MAQDKHLICQQCGASFLYSEGEQKFYREKGFSDPKRCKPCREKLKRERGQVKPKPENAEYGFEKYVSDSKSREDWKD